MPAKRDKFVKGRRSKPVGEGKLKRKSKTAPKMGRVTRKQRDIVKTNGNRKVIKSPRKPPPA